MIYSRWDPSSGDYDYFEAPERPGINDDLPIPDLPTGTDIGVPSVECGRPLPPGASHVGTGDAAVGLITPPAGVQNLKGAGSDVSERTFYFMLGGTVALLGVYLYVASRPR